MSPSDESTSFYLVETRLGVTRVEAFDIGGLSPDGTDIGDQLITDRLKGFVGDEIIVNWEAQS